MTSRRRRSSDVVFGLLVSLVVLFHVPTPVQSCNEAVCASIVSKCTLLKSCECEIETGKPCVCCERCKKCLDYLLTECCSCFGLCRKPNITEMTHESVVFDLEPVPPLFEALTAKPEGGEGLWDLFTFPVDLHPTQVYRPKSDGSKTAVSSSSEQETLVLEKEELVTVNCTVVFLRQCTAKSKCKTSCATMGASYGRWFEDGCCECVGHNCRDYGINESRCSECEAEDEDLEEFSDDELDQVQKKLEEEVYQDGGGATDVDEDVVGGGGEGGSSSSGGKKAKGSG